MITRDVSPARFVAALAVGLAAGGVTAADFADAQESAAKRHPLAATSDHLTATSDHLTATSDHPLAISKHPLAATNEFLVADAKTPQLVLEQPATPVWTKAECVSILSWASKVVARVTETNRAKGLGVPYNPEFPVSFAKYLAPNDHEIVRDILIKGNFAEIAASKSPETLPFRRRLVAALTCTGDRNIIVNGYGIATWNTIKDILAEEAGIDLEGKGRLRSVLPPGVVGSLPASPKSLNSLGLKQAERLKLN